jgi:hypothetical protein
MIDTRESLYALLPAYVRQRDQQAGGALAQWMAIVADQVILLERDCARMYDDWFIETCADWVVPYIADLLGHGAPGSSGATRLAAGSAASAPRREVANLLAYRRRKGTAALLDELARDGAAWPALAVEMHRRVLGAQHLDHVHARRLGTPELHAVRTLAAGELPFDHSCHIADVRRPSNEESRGLYDAGGLALFVFRTQAFTVTSTSAHLREDIGDHCFTFSVLGNDAPLYRHSAPVTDACLRTSAPELPLPLGRFEIEADAAADASSAAIAPAFYGEGRSIQIRAPKWLPREAAGAGPAGDLIPASAVIPADLTDWAYKVRKNHVAVDPVLGRIMFPASQPPRKRVQVSYAYGFAMKLGGGEYARAPLPMPAQVTRRRVRAIDAGPPAEGEFDSIAAAIADWRQQQTAQAGAEADGARASALSALVVELADSGLYRALRELRLARGESLWIVAAPLARPVLWLSDEDVGAADGIAIRGAAGSRLALEGILIAGRGIAIAPAHDPLLDEEAARPGDEGDLCEILVRHCTLVPGWGLSHDCEPRHPSEPSIVLDGTRACLRIDHSIVGAIRVNLDARGPPARVLIDNSIVDATSGTRTAIGAAGDGVAFARLAIARSTIVGSVRVHEIERGDDSLFVGELTVARRQTGCIRYSYVTPGSRTPRRHRCQPELATAAVPRPAPGEDPAPYQRRLDDVALRTAPRFAATRYGSPHYLRLTSCTSPAIARGAEGGAEMGVYHELLEPQRVDRLAASLDHYAPADIAASVVIAS